MTAKVSFKEPNLLSSASSAAHVSLSSHLQLSNNRQTHKPSQNQRPKPKAQSNKPASANPLDFLRTRNFVASSAAALVSEWAYNPTKPKQST
ncbi:hypothetical protein, partial [Rhizobium mesosinicum]|uniref:hypothetical protein n=1 Tax=Rhizobium mesosinicum TaxID=335017 RepID=UPI001C6E6EF6